jgi:hypothetical protein
MRRNLRIRKLFSAEFAVNLRVIRRSDFRTGALPFASPRADQPFSDIGKMVDQP